MKLQVQVFSVEKAGNEPNETEDAWACAEGSADLLAVSDGASDAFNSSSWARILTSTFVESRPGWTPDAVLGWLPIPVGIWRADIHWEALPWYCEEKAKRGSFATLLAFGLEPIAS